MSDLKNSVQSADPAAALSADKIHAAKPLLLMMMGNLLSKKIPAGLTAFFFMAIPLCRAQSPTPTPIPPAPADWYQTFDLGSLGVRGYWPCDGDLQDRSGYGDETVTDGAVSYVSGRMGQGVDVTSRTINLGDSGIVSNAFTIAMWVWTNSEAGNQTLLRRAEGEAFSSNYSLYLEDDGSQRLKFKGAWMNSAVEFPQPLSTGTWQHVAVTFDSSILCLYLDGQKVLQAQPSLKGYSYANGNLGIGMDPPHAPKPWHGYIDDLTIFLSPLSSTQIGKLAADTNSNGVADFWDIAVAQQVRTPVPTPIPLPEHYTIYLQDDFVGIPSGPVIISGVSSNGYWGQGSGAIPGGADLWRSRENSASPISDGVSNIIWTAVRNTDQFMIDSRYRTMDDGHDTNLIAFLTLNNADLWVGWSDSSFTPYAGVELLGTTGGVKVTTAPYTASTPSTVSINNAKFGIKLTRVAGGGQLKFAKHSLASGDARDPADPGWTDSGVTYNTNIWEGPNTYVFLNSLGGGGTVVLDYVSELSDGTPVPTPTPIPTPMPPAAPTGLQARGGANCVALVWNPNLEADIAGYYLYRALSANGPFIQRLTVSPIIGTSYVDNIVANGQQYYYKIAAINAQNVESAQSSIAATIAGAVTLTMPDYRGHPGTTTTLQINCSNATGITGNGMDIKITYDTAILTPVDIQKTVLTRNFTFADNLSVANGQINISGFSESGAVISGEGRLFEITFLVSPTAPLDAVATHAFVNVKLYDAQLNALTVDYSDTARLIVSENYGMGDVNGDGEIDAADALLTQRGALGQALLNSVQFLAANVNGDDVLDSADVTLILRLAVGLPINLSDPAGKGENSAPKISGKYGISIPPVNGPSGTTVGVPIYLDKLQDIAGMQMRINYDSSLLTFLDITRGSAADGFALQYKTGVGTVAFSLSRATRLTGEEAGEIAVVYFNLNGAVGETSPVNLSQSKLTGQYGENIAWHHSVSVNNGIVTVDEGSSSVDMWYLYR